MAIKRWSSVKKEENVIEHDVEYDYIQINR